MLEDAVDEDLEAVQTKLLQIATKPSSRRQMPRR